MRQKLLAAALIFALAVLPAQAADKITPRQPVNYAAWYKVNWGGFYSGDIVLEVQEGRGEYRTKIDMRAVGFAKDLVNYRSVTEVEGWLDKEGGYHPKRYDTDYSYRKKSKHIVLHYDRTGKITRRSYVPEENRDKRPDVEEKLRDTAFDPITIGLAARLKILEQMTAGKDTFTLPLYDGLRRDDIHFTIHGREKIVFGKKERPVVHVSFTQEPKAGYTNNEKKRMPKERPVYDMYISDDDAFVPLKTIAAAPLGTAVILQKRVCKTYAECEKARDAAE